MFLSFHVFYDILFPFNVSHCLHTMWLCFHIAPLIKTCYHPPRYFLYVVMFLSNLAGEFPSSEVVTVALCYFKTLLFCLRIFFSNYHQTEDDDVFLCEPYLLLHHRLMFFFIPTFPCMKCTVGKLWHLAC